MIPTANTGRERNVPLGGMGYDQPAMEKLPETTFALLGSHPLAHELTRHLSPERGERLVATTSDPADILAIAGLDVLILADVSPTSLAVAERIAPRTSLLVIPDARLTSSFVYSLVLQDQDGASVLLPAFPLRYDPRIRELRERIELGTLGQIVAVRFERQGRSSALPGTAPTGNGLPPVQGEDRARGSFLNQAEAQGAILHDAEVLRSLLGEFRKVSAVQAGAGEELANLTVTFGGAEGTSPERGAQQGPDVFWTYRRGDRDQADLILQCERGDIRLAWNGPHLGSVSIGGQVLPPTAAPVATSILEELRKRRENRPSEVKMGAGPGEAGAGATWTDLLRDFDLVDAVGRSIRRRRTIDLHFEETSERNQFKTQMTAAGCAVAMFTLVGLVLLLAVGAFADPRDSQQRLAEGARLVIHQSTAPDGHGLTEEQEEELKLVQKNYRVSPTAILVEGASADDPRARALREVVVGKLEKAGFADANERVVVRVFRGQWFARAMIAAWVVLFLPLAVFIVLQGLLLITRSGGPSEE